MRAPMMDAALYLMTNEQNELPPCHATLPLPRVGVI